MRAARLVVALGVIAAAAGVPPRAEVPAAAREGGAASWDPIYRLRVGLASRGAMKVGVGGGFRLVEAAVERRRGGKPQVKRLRGEAGAFKGFPDLALRLRRPGRALFVLAVAPTGTGPLTLAVRGGGRVRVRGDDGRLAAERVDRRGAIRVPAVAVAAAGEAPGTDPLPPEVYAFYYQWYANHHWTDGSTASSNVNPLPYDSGDEPAITRHIVQAQQAGLDGFVVSWIGSGSGPDQNLQTLVSLLPPGLGFALYVEIHYPPFLEMDSLVDELEYILETYATHPSYLRYRGEPLIYVFSSLHVFRDHFESWNPKYLEVWQGVNDELERRGHDVALVGEGRPFTSNDYTVFDGMHMYMTEGESFSERLNERMSLVARAWAAVHGGPRRFYAATPIPGYDDRHIPGRPRSYHFPREGGALYRRQWASATDVAADQAVVVSFNEWFETTNIEPNAAWGTQYLTLTRELGDAFRASRG